MGVLGQTPAKGARGSASVLLVTCLLLLLQSDRAAAFVTRLPLRETPRWSAEPYRGTGLHDGIQVGVQAGIQDGFGLSPEEAALLQQAVADAFSAWESSVLNFDVAFDAPVVRGTQPGEGFEIDVFALAGDDPVFLGTEFFGAANFSVDPVEERLLTNGQRTDGLVIVGGEIYLNVDNILAFRDAFALTPEQQAAAFQRLLMHEIGHLLALDHPNELPESNIDSDFNPLTLIPVDVCDVEAGLFFSFNFDRNAVMSNAPNADGILVTSPRADDRSGRDVLYPAPPPGATCGPYPPRGVETPGTVVLDTGLLQANDLLLDEQGRLLVAVANDVIRVDEAGSEESLLSDEAVDLLGVVLRVALGPDGALFVTGLNDNAIRVAPGGQVVEIIDASGDGVNAFDFGDSITVDREGNAYIASRNTDSVFRVDPHGGIERVVGPDAPLRAPSGVVTDSAGNLYVTGLLSNNVLKRTPDGEVREILDFAGVGDGVPFARPEGPVVDAADRAYAVSNRAIVYRFHPDETVEVYRDPAGVLSPPIATSNLTLDALGNVYVADQIALLALQYPAEGGVETLFQAERGPLDPATVILHIATDPLGALYVAWRRGVQNEVFRVDPPCGDTVPVIRRAVPRRPLAGSFVFLLGRGFQPGARAFLGRQVLEGEVSSSRALFAYLPPGSVGDAELRVGNPPSCISAARPIHVLPAPPWCGKLGAELALVPPVWLAYRMRRRRKGAARSDP